MFERFPKESVRVLFLSRGAALAAGATSIESDHLLAGALDVWQIPGVEREIAVQHIGLTVRPQPPPPGSPEIPFSTSVKRVLNSAVIVADELGHHRIRPEHLLLALLDEPDNQAGQTLRRCGVERQTLIDSAAREAMLDDSLMPYRTRATVRISDE